MKDCKCDVEEATVLVFVAVYANSYVCVCTNVCGKANPAKHVKLNKEQNICPSAYKV